MSLEFFLLLRFPGCFLSSLGDPSGGEREGGGEGEM